MINWFEPLGEKSYKPNKFKGFNMKPISSFAIMAFFALAPNFAICEEVAIKSCTSWREMNNCNIEMGKQTKISNALATNTNANELGAKIAPDAFIGLYTFDVPNEGNYLIKVSSKTWIDVFQDGEKLRSKGSQTPSSNDWFVKSVRFELAQRKANILLAGAIPENATIEITKE